MASQTIQPVVNMPLLAAHHNDAEENQYENIHYKPETNQINDALGDQAVEQSTNLADVDHSEDSNLEPDILPGEVSDEPLAAQRDISADYDVSTSHLQAQTEKVGTDVALAGSLTREMAFEWACHIVALAFTFYLASLSFTHYYWVDEHQWNDTWYFAHLSQENALKALQFAAKAHETFIIMSLFAIVLHLVRRRLTRSKGMSIGHLVSGYQIESLSLLFKKRLWSPAFDHPLQDPGAVVVTVVLFIAVLLAKLVGPASAILVLPSLRWWSVDNPFVLYQQPWFSSNCTEIEMYPVDLRTKYDHSVWSDEFCTQSNMTMWCPGAGWDELNEWSGNNALRSNPGNLTMSMPTNGYFQRTLASTSRGGTYSGNGFDSFTTETATTLHNGVAEFYMMLWQDIQHGKVDFTQKIERPYLMSRQSVKGVVTQVQCKSFPRSQLSINQSLKSDELGFIRPIPVSIWNATGSGPTSTVNLTWIDMEDTMPDQKSIGVLVTLPQAFQSRHGVEPEDDITLRQETVICLCAVDARWAPVSMGWDPSTTGIISNNLTKDFPPDRKDYNGFFDEYSASETIRIGLDWANMLNVGGRQVMTASGQIITASSIEALFWRHMYQYRHAGDDAPVWSRGSLKYYYDYIQPDNDSWHGFWTEELAAQILSLAVTDGISHAADWAAIDVVYNTSQPQPGHYSTTVDISRYGWGYGLSGVTIFAICVLFTHTAMVLAYAVYTIYLAIRGKSVTYRMLANVGELVVMSLDSWPTLELRSDKEPPWNMTISVREKDENRLELITREDVGDLPQAGKEYRRVNSGGFWNIPGTLRWRRRIKG